MKKCFLYKFSVSLTYKISNMINSKIMHFSTDCVFDGKKGNYNEDYLPNANDIYGMSKALGELNYNNSLTLRTSIIGQLRVS